MAKNFKLIIMLTMASIVLVSCGPTNQFKRARKLDQNGKYYEAWIKYQNFVADFPKHALAPEALFRAGLMAQIGMQDCYAANTFYQELLTSYPQADQWVRAAKLQPTNCPDFFPLVPGSEWVEGDSDTKGEVSKTIIHCKPLTSNKDTLPSEAGIIKRTFYAGKEKFRDSSFLYRKVNGEVLEFPSEKDGRSKIILKWPAQMGDAWRTLSGGRAFNFNIESVDEIVKVQAGEFQGCIKVRSSIEGGVGARFEYFAPGVGRVLTTLSSAKGETRNTELLSYSMADYPSFESDETQKSKDSK